MEIKKSKGFTLLEIVLGIVVISIVTVTLVPMMFIFTKNTVDPLFDTKANFIVSDLFYKLKQVSYDEKSDHNGGQCRCGEVLYSKSGQIICNSNCTVENEFGPDDITSMINGSVIGSEKNQLSSIIYNDVDDFDTLKICSNSFIQANYCSNNVNFCTNNSYCMVEANFFLGQFDSLSGDAFSQLINKLESDNELIYSDALYKHFYVKIQVEPYTYEGINFKKVKVFVIDPSEQVMEFSFLKGNY